MFDEVCRYSSDETKHSQEGFLTPPLYIQVAVVRPCTLNDSPYIVQTLHGNSTIDSSHQQCAPSQSIMVPTVSSSSFDSKRSRTYGRTLYRTNSKPTLGIQLLKPRHARLLTAVHEGFGFEECLCGRLREERVREQRSASLWVTCSSDDHGDRHVLEMLIGSISISEGPERGWKKIFHMLEGFTMWRIHVVKTLKAGPLIDTAA